MQTLSLLKQLLIAIVLTLGLLHGLMLALSPVVGAYRGDIERLFGDELETDVQIGSVATRWRWLSPVMVLGDVRIGGEEDGISIEHATLGIYLPGLFGDEPGDMLRVGLTGLKLRLIRETDGRLRLSGLVATASETPTGGRIPQHAKLVDAELIFEDRRVGRAPLHLAPLYLLLDRDGNKVELRGHLGSDFGRLAVAATIDGDLSGTDWRGAIRVEAEDVAVAPLIKGYTADYFELEALTLNGELLSLWEAALPVQVTGRATFDDLQLTPLKPDEPPVSLPHLSTGLIRFQRDGDNYQLLLDGLDVTGRDGPWPATDLALAMDTGSPLQIQADLGFLRVQDLLDLLRLRAPWAQLGDARELAPRGDIEDLRVAVKLGNEGLDWQGSCRFRDLSIRRAGDVPGLSGFNGSWRGNVSHIQALLDSTDVELDFGELFQAPLRLERLAGQIDWRVGSAGGWLLQSDRLEIATPHFETTSRLLLEHSGKDLPRIDMQMDIGPALVADLGHYYPRAVMRDRLVQWLEEGLIDGRINSTSVVMSGPLGDFPFDRTRSGSLIANLEAEDLIVDYHREWPRMEQVDASIRFHNNDLEIQVADGRLFDSRLLDGTTIKIAQMDPATPVEVKGKLHGPLADDLRVLAESPLKEDFADFVAALRASGTATLTLDLAVPIDELGEYRLDGRLDFERAGLYLKGWQLPVTDIRGALQFDLDALRGDGLTAVALDRPVKVAVVPEKSGATRIDVDGRLGIDRIQRQLPWLPLTHIASGVSDFRVGIHIPALDQDDQPTRLSVASALQGVTLTLPEPLAKPPARATQVHIEVPLESGSGPVRIRYGELADAQLDGDLSRGEVVLGGGRASFPREPLLRVRGRLEQVDPIPWIEFFATLPQQQGASPDRAPLDLDLTAGTLQLGGMEFADVRLMLDELADRWQGQLQSKRIAGSFRVPVAIETTPVEINLERIDIPLQTTESDADTTAEPTADTDPRDLPAFRLTSKHLLVNGNSMGSLELHAQKHAGGLHFSPFNIEGDMHGLFATGDWRLQGNATRSAFSGRIKTKSLGTMLEHLGFDRQLERAPADIDFDLAWPGDPAAITDRRLDGTLGLDMGAGGFLEIEPGVARVAGLLNFNGLFRRLRLDFRDLFSKGYSFDSINGGFQLTAGEARTEDLQIKGPSGLVQIKGRTGLLTRDFDQHVTVTPRLDATLPIAGTLAAGPIGGAVALVAQQVLSDRVDEINRFQYRVTGPWDKPEITQLDTGGSLSKLLKPLSPDAGGQADDDGPETGNGDGMVESPPTSESLDPDSGEETVPTSGLFERLWDQLREPAEHHQSAGEVPLD